MFLECDGSQHVHPSAPSVVPADQEKKDISGNQALINFMALYLVARN